MTKLQELTLNREKKRALPAKCGERLFFDLSEWNKELAKEEHGKHHGKPGYVLPLSAANLYKAISNESKTNTASDRAGYRHSYKHYYIHVVNPI